MIGIIVRDMTASLNFYRQLGLEIPVGAESESHVEVKSHGYRIAWDTEELIRSINPDWVEPHGQRMTLAFLCESPQEVDQVYHVLESEGYRALKAPWDAFWGQRYAIIADPDGNAVDLFAPL